MHSALFYVLISSKCSSKANQFEKSCSSVTYIAGMDLCPSFLGLCCILAYNTSNVFMPARVLIIIRTK